MNRPAAVIIGSSTGGTKILEFILSKLPSTNDFNVFIVQHIPALFIPRLCERLNRLCKLQTRQAADGEIVKNSCVYIAPGESHLKLKTCKNQKENVCIELSNETYKFGIRPSIDITMKSALDIYKNNIIGVLLSGMGDDGFEGIKSIKAAGGFVIAQDPTDCVIRTMPENIIKAGLTDEILDRNHIGIRINEILS